jgi:hypothetical protein
MESNHQPPVYKTGALTGLSYISMRKSVIINLLFFIMLRKLPVLIQQLSPLLQPPLGGAVSYAAFADRHQAKPEGIGLAQLHCLGRGG